MWVIGCPVDTSAKQKHRPKRAINNRPYTRPKQTPQGRIMFAHLIVREHRVEPHAQRVVLAIQKTGCNQKAATRF